MTEQKIYIIGEEEIVLMMGLLGIEGLVLNQSEEFVKEFDTLKQDTSIGMIIIAMELLDDDIQILMDHKLGKKKPFIFYLPDIFKAKPEERTGFLKEIFKSIGKIIK